jgi:dihydrofolate synthase / folylpolyglutamate synthase
MADVAAELADQLARLQTLHPQAIDLSLDRVERLLTRLGNPERHLPPVVHVAGTNGKGSTIALLRAFIEAAGHRVHVYTSPHLLNFRERIRLAGSLIQDGQLLAQLQRVEIANAGDPITAFEATTVAALLSFAETPADILLLEVGLGGRLDATNVVVRPVVSLLTRISFDHMSFLGDSLTAIAGEKAGIIKQGRPVLVQRQIDPAILSVFQTAADRQGAPLLHQDHHWHIERTRDGFRYRTSKVDMDLPNPVLPGPHQLDNAGLALAALPFLPVTVDRHAIIQGLGRVNWPGRMQRITDGPLMRLLPPGSSLWLDGAHNDSAADALAETVTGLSGGDGRPWRLVWGMLADKQADRFISAVGSVMQKVIAVSIAEEPRARAVDQLCQLAATRGYSIRSAAAIPEALMLCAEDGKPVQVVIAGSLSLVAAALRLNGESLT